jgi:ABC-type nitrate/sulfonate/bicarbonate transport system substrate-binding protein
LRLKVVTGGTGAAVSNAALAQSLGYFKDENLEVSMTAAASSTVINSILTGASDIAGFSNSAVVLAAQEGKSATVLFGYLGNHQAGSFIARSGITTIEQLQALPNCKLATGTPGGSFYGYVNYYMKRLNLKCTTTQFSDSTIAIGTVVAGTYDGGAFSLSNIGELGRQGKVNLLVDTSKKADRDTYLPPGEFTSNSWYASTDWLKTHKEEAIRFVRALGKVDRAYRTMTPDQLGAALHNSPDPAWNVTSAADWTAQFVVALPFLDPNNGYITEADWNNGLDFFSLWGLAGYDAKNPLFAYSVRVDMSYYETAIGPKPK